MNYRCGHLVPAVIMILGMTAGSLQATTWHVRQDGTGDFTTVGAAVAAASAGDVIEIGPGTYPEHLTVTIGVDFVSTDGAAATVLDGTDDGRILLCLGATGCSVSGLTFANGNLNPGGAVDVENGGSLSIAHCVFRGNHSSHDGGAVFCDHGSSLEVEYCDFASNQASWNCGAGGASGGSSATFRFCVFKDNHAGTLSGGLGNFANSPLVIEKCLFIRNSAQAAGAVLIQGSAAIVRNNTFFENSSTAGDGATVNFYTGYACVLEQNIVTADLAGYGMRLLNGADHGCNLIFANAAGPVLDGVLVGNELEVDPLFCDYHGDDFYLCGESLALPENNDCGLMGAHGMGCVECGPVATESVSWGVLKNTYR